MKASQLLHHHIAGTKVEMIRVGQFHLRMDFLQIHGGDAPLNGRRCTHIHEYWRLNGSVDSGHFCPFRFPIRGYYFIHTLPDGLNRLCLLSADIQPKGCRKTSL